MVKKVLARAGLALLVALVALGIFAWVNPWPSVLVVRTMWPRPDADQVARMEALEPRGITLRKDVVVNPEDPDGRVDIYRPEAAGDRALPTIVWVHGGGFITGTKDAMTTYLTQVAAPGYEVVAVEYSVAPGARYPRPVEQVTTAIDFLVTHATEYGVDPTQIVLAGDSAGAHIAAQTAMAITEPGYAEEAGLPRAETPDGVRATVLYSGAFDMTLLDDANGMGRWMVQTMLWAYTGSKDPQTVPSLQWASLPQHVTFHYPPSFVSTGPGDPLDSQSKSMANHLAAAGVEVDALWFPHAPDSVGHEYAMDLLTPQGRQSMRDLLRFLRAHLDTPVPLTAPADSW